MNDPSRRQFLKITGVAAATLGMPLHAAAGATQVTGKMTSSSTIFMDQDGLGLTPAELSTELARLCATQDIQTDAYGLGGAVEETEHYFAKVLGKERALFMPTGTLANQLALRALAGSKRRVVLQDVSHIHNDTGDASSILSGLTLLPLAPNAATFTWSEVEQTLGRTASGRVRTEVGALSIESPVRRRAGELFDRKDLEHICREARQRGIGLHLDGARLFIASAYTGIAPAEYARPFDTVYVSLWKYFNALNGAILAGPATLLDGMFHTRRMFGGALFQAWPFALLARRYAEGFVERLQSAVAISNEFIQVLAGSALKVERVPNGTNIFKLVVPDVKADGMRDRLLAMDVVLTKPVRGNDGAIFYVYVNESWSRTTGERLAAQFKKAVAG